MAKDPATLWYWNDWQGGTATLTRHLKGCYMDLLHAQFNSGRLSLAQIKTVLGVDFGTCWPMLLEKFKKDESGRYYNQKAEEEKEKRRKYGESRRNNLKKSHMAPHMGAHMDNENENVIDIRIKEQILNSEKLLVDLGFYETVAIGWGINKEGLTKMILAFELLLAATNKKHPSYDEYKSHFYFWGAKRFTEYLPGSSSKKMVL